MTSTWYTEEEPVDLDDERLNYEDEEYTIEEDKEWDGDF